MATTRTKPTKSPVPRAARPPREGTQPRPDNTKPLFINTPLDLLERLDAAVDRVRASDPMRARATKTDLVLDAIRRWLDESERERPAPSPRKR